MSKKEAEEDIIQNAILSKTLVSNTFINQNNTNCSISNQIVTESKDSIHQRFLEGEH